MPLIQFNLYFRDYLCTADDNFGSYSWRYGELTFPGSSLGRQENSIVGYFIEVMVFC